ncbi:hypothetical protein [Desulfocurvibacter africanus]|uniref:Uncharacterized protein n=1 Tax=Desulfocurvibacter africanus subsp. africanus str. Walvis Bay TaxID=690850 RepID=F3YXG3_DESAF|nr:hypothetical protein [Desulfocurvibacter africanus]EGJ51740.1 hypothetical protein Desaf_3456 [Desulfocurvibacter africanus subsp. africanus str. Walvis Bay]
MSTHSRYASIVRAHIRAWRSRAIEELDWYKAQGDLPEAIERAGLAKRHDGKRHSHQTRIPRRVLEEARDALLSIQTDLRAACSFDELFQTIRDRIEPIGGIGELTIYDTAQRIGACLGLAPQHVYLHAGTRQGAKCLGLDCTAGKIAMDALPREFRELEPYEIEDCLCIYKGKLENASKEHSTKKSRCFGKVVRKPAYSCVGARK